MEDIIMNENLNEIEEVNEELDFINEESETNGIVRVAALIGTVVTGTAIGLVVKNRKKITDKIDEHRVKKLQKKGYEIYEPVVEAVEEEINESETEEESKK